jgi:hypothetical protein
MREFTLHDAEHLFHVLYIMSKLIPSNVLEKLTLPELMLLIMCAFFHDIGMAPDEFVILSWEKNWDSNPTFTSGEEKEEFLQFKKHLLSHQQINDEIESANKMGEFTKTELLREHFISDYIRSTHADRLKDTIKRDWNGKILYHDADMTIEFLDLCRSHCEDAMSLINMDYTYLSGKVCLPLLGVILRLADILDFDSKRTPSVLFSHLYVRNPVSIMEWNKHRAVESWMINDNIISFQAKCTHPAIEASIHDFCDIIDNELKLCNNILGEIMKHEDNRDLRFRLPLQITRNKITTKKDIDGNPEYFFSRTQFTLSKRQVIDLLMGTKLYGNPEVALRELIQNSIDACLLRMALEKKWGNSYEPKIVIKYYNENDIDYLEVNDNGIGMDQEVIDKYYSKIGSSFYTSSDFYELKSEYNPDFKPMARFGIGILSCFMVTDTIVVDTKKITGPNSSSDAFNITIEGQDSIFWVKKGNRQKVGTDTRLSLRKKKHPWEKMGEEEFIDSVKKLVPNPPFCIEITTDKKNEKINEQSFQLYSVDDLKGSDWEDNENLRQIDIKIDRIDRGYIGMAKIGLLETHGNPERTVTVKSTIVRIEDDDYTLEKEIKLSSNEIQLLSSSITVNDDGKIEKQNFQTTIAKSRSRISLHGIEVPMSLFPTIWETQKGQAQLAWPFPMLIILDVCGERDLNLNSSRSLILSDERWFEFEEDIVIEICSQIKQKVGNEYWNALLPIIQKTKNQIFLEGLKRVEHVI